MTIQADKLMHRVANALPVFTAREIRSNVTTLTAEDSIVFLVHTDCTYRINGTGNAAPLTAGVSVRGMPIGATNVVFSVPVTVEIM